MKAKSKAKSKARKRHYSDGLLWSFHGSFKSESAADRKARAVGGFYKRKFIMGMGVRFVVMAKRDDVPF